MGEVEQVLQLVRHGRGIGGREQRRCRVAVGGAVVHVVQVDHLAVVRSGSAARCRVVSRADHVGIAEIPDQPAAVEVRAELVRDEHQQLAVAVHVGGRAEDAGHRGQHALLAASPRTPGALRARSGPGPRRRRRRRRPPKRRPASRACAGGARSRGQGPRRRSGGRRRAPPPRARALRRQGRLPARGRRRGGRTRAATSAGPVAPRRRRRVAPSGCAAVAPSDCAAVAPSGCAAVAATPSTVTEACASSGPPAFTSSTPSRSSPESAG